MSNENSGTGHLETAAQVVLRAQQGPTFLGPGDRYTFLMTGAQSGGSGFIVDCLVPPGGGPPPHIHHREDERFLIIDGTLSVTVGDQTVEAQTGDFITALKGVPHTYRNIGTTVAHMIAFFTPAGMEGWFAEALNPAGDTPGFVPATPELLARMVALGPNYGVEWV